MTPEQRKQQQRAWYQKNKTRILANQMDYKKSHIEQVNQRRRAWYQKNKARVLAHNREYLKSHPRKQRNPYNVAYYQKNKAHILAKVSKYVENNKEKIKPQQAALQQKYRTNLASGYLRALWVNHSTLTASDIPNELLQIKKLQILLKRELRRQRENNGSNSRSSSPTNPGS